MENEQTLPAGAPKPGTYRHYKGALYQVFGMAQHSETDEWLVVYQALYGEEGFWVRPLSLWLQAVADDAHPDAPSTTRFALVTPSQRTLKQLTKQQ